MASYDHPDLYVNIVPPTVRTLNGVPSNIGGVVGSASWGPVNAPTPFSGQVAGAALFGPLNARKYDLMTAVTVAAMQGNGGSFVGVRVTDGSDTAASGSLGNNGSSAFWTSIANALNTGLLVSRGPSNIVTAAAGSTNVTLTGKYTGSLGNKVTATLSAGSAANTYRMTVSLPNQTPEIFDNLAAGVGAATQATGSITFTTNPANSTTITLNGSAVTFVTSGATGNQVNIGATLTATLTALLSLLQGSSDTQLVKFQYNLNTNVLALTAVTAGTGGNSLTVATTVSGASVSGGTLTGGTAAITAPTLPATVTLSGGADGASSITKAILLGSNVAPRTGMYALRNTGASAAILVDLDDPTSWVTQDTFAKSEALIMGVCGPAGDTINNAESVKIANGIDTAWLKCLHGDWITFNDTYNNSQRKISPQGYWLGRRINIGPHETTLNKPLLGIVSTEKTATNQVYDPSTEIAQLYRDGYDVITNPAPGGNYFACVTGRNGSSNQDTRGENYTTTTNYLTATLNAGMGVWIGKLQSGDATDTTRRGAKATLDGFLTNLLGDGAAQPRMIDSFQVQLDNSNNSLSAIAAGFLTAYVKVRYLAVVEFFVINLEGGQNVQINSTVLPASAIGTAQYSVLNAPFTS